MHPPMRDRSPTYSQATLPSKWMVNSPIVVAVPLSDTVAVPLLNTPKSKSLVNVTSDGSAVTVPWSDAWGACTLRHL